MRVFLSSRFEEHRQLRQALKVEFASYHHVAIDLNDGRADDRSVQRRSFDELGRSDAVVLILGATYGVAVDGDKSMTDLEFRHALALDKPIFAYFTAEPDYAAAAQLQQEVKDVVVYVNRLVNNTTEAALRIVMDVVTSFSGAVSDAALDSEVAGDVALSELAREANYLGFRAEWYGTEVAGASRSAIRAQVAELTGLAFQALRLGHADVALVQLNRALDIHPLEWVPAYALAWLAAKAERRTNLLDARQAARRSATVAQRAADLAETDAEHELYGRRLTASHIVVARLAISLGDYAEARTSLDRALAASGWSRPAMLQRFRLAALDGEGLDQMEDLAARLLRTYPRELRQLLQTSDLQRRRRSVEANLVDRLAMVSMGVKRERKRRFIRLDDAIGLIRVDYTAMIMHGRASLLDLVPRSSRLAAIIGLEQGQSMPYASMEDAEPVVTSLSAERRRLSVFIRGSENPWPAPADLARFGAETAGRLTNIARADRDDAMVVRRLDIDDQRDQDDRARLRRSPLPSAIAVAASTALAFVVGLIVAGAHVGVVVAVLAAVAAWLGRRRLAPVAEWAMTFEWRSRRRDRAQEQREVEARLAKRADERRVLEARLRSIHRLAQVEHRLATIRSLLRPSASGSLERQEIGALVLRLVNQKNEFAQWAAVIAPQEYLPRRRCRQGAITRVRPGSRAIGGVRPSATTEWLVRCLQPAAAGGVMVVSDLAVFGDARLQQEEFASFEQFVSRRWPNVEQARPPWPPPLPPTAIPRPPGPVLAPVRSD